MRDNKYTMTIQIVGTLFISYCFFGLSLGWGLYFGLKVFLILGVVLLIHGLLRRSSSKYNKSTYNKVVNILIGIAIISCFILEGLIFTGANFNDISNIDYVIVLGAGVKEDRPSLELKYRLDSAIEFVKKEGSSSKIIVCGGRGSDEENSEAFVMEKYLLEHGIDKSMIIKEEKSTTTYENIQYADIIIREGEVEKSSKKIAICTNDFHVFRAKLIAKDMGYDVAGLPSKTPLYIIPNHHVREYFAICVAFLTRLL